MLNFYFRRLFDFVLPKNITEYRYREFSRVVCNAEFTLILNYVSKYVHEHEFKSR